jgi:hypothetical protein
MWKKILVFLLILGVIGVLLSMVAIVYLLDEAKAAQKSLIVARLTPAENHHDGSLSFSGKVLVTSMDGEHIVFYGTHAFEAEQYDGLIEKKFILSLYDSDDKIIHQRSLEPTAVVQLFDNPEQYFAISCYFMVPGNTQFLRLEIEKMEGSNLPPVKSVVLLAKNGDARLAVNISFILVSIFAFKCAALSLVFLYILLDTRKREKRLASVNHS